MNSVKLSQKNAKKVCVDIGLKVMKIKIVQL
jgi:hypothetical protein